MTFLITAIVIWSVLGLLVFFEKVNSKDFYKVSEMEFIRLGLLAGPLAWLVVALTGLMLAYSDWRGKRDRPS